MITRYALNALVTVRANGDKSYAVVGDLVVLFRRLGLVVGLDAETFPGLGGMASVLWSAEVLREGVPRNPCREVPLAGTAVWGAA